MAKNTITEPIENYALSKTDALHGQFSKIGIVGCGTTGQRLALTIASKGIEVIFLDKSQDKIDWALSEIYKEIDGRIVKWGMTEGEKRAIQPRLQGTLSYEDFAECDMVIEAILSETRNNRIEIRKEIFKNIENHTRKDAIITTNSTTTVVTELSSELEHKDRCISMHISTTLSDSNIIEVVKGLHTSDEVCSKIRQFATLIGKVAIPVEESAGLVSVRLFVGLFAEACQAYTESVSSLENIDAIMKNSLGLPLGPFEFADKIGLDRVKRWMDNLYTEFGNLKYKPAAILKRKVNAQQFGRKAGAGFYTYDENGKILRNK